MKKTAILIDGEWFRRRLETSLNPTDIPHGITADVLYRNALLSVDGSKEEIFRIFYYDCPPFEGKEVNPISQQAVDFSNHPKTAARKRFLLELKANDYVAMRLGLAKKRGWTLTQNYTKQAIQGSHAPPGANDVFCSFEQKGVDMRIGIDVATLSLKRLVDRIILISGDTDMIPAMKLARREGVQVILVEVDHAQCHGLAKSLDEDADLVRRITPIP